MDRGKVSLELPDMAWQGDIFSGFFDASSLPFAKTRSLATLGISPAGSRFAHARKAAQAQGRSESLRMTE